MTSRGEPGPNCPTTRSLETGGISTAAPVRCLTAFRTSTIVELRARIVNCPPWKLTSGGDDGPCSGVNGGGGTGAGVGAGWVCAAFGLALALRGFRACAPTAEAGSRTLKTMEANKSEVRDIITYNLTYNLDAILSPEEGENTTAAARSSPSVHVPE